MPPDLPPGAGDGLSRRSFLKSASLAAVATTTATAGTADARSERYAPSKRFGPGSHDIVLKVNGTKREVTVETRTTLLEALRDKLDLTGTKEICDRGACGGCTVLLDGKSVNACMMLAFDAQDHELRTIEGLADGDRLHPLQQEFIRCDALQCGFCTPGMVMAGVACLSRTPQPSRAEIRRALAGNLCRCGTYTRVVDAIEATAKRGGR